MSTFARQQTILQARAALERHPVYLDTETTGLEDTAEIVDICILDDAGRTLIDSLVRPTQPIPAQASAVHGITNAMVSTAPTWPELWPQIKTALEGRTIATYNADYDQRLMRQSHKRHRLPWDLEGVEFFCIMKLYAQFRGNWDSYRGTYKWHKLEAAGQQCQLSLPNSHRALADTQLARAVLLHMAQA